MSGVSPRPSFQIGFKAPPVPTSGLAHLVNILPKSSLRTGLAQRKTSLPLILAAVVYEQSPGEVSCLGVCTSPCQPLKKDYCCLSHYGEQYGGSS